MSAPPAPRLTLKSSQFRREREAGWRELELLLAQAHKRGVTALSPADLERLPLLYRAALSSLSVARAIALDRHLLLYLEDLSLRAYLVVYGPQTSIAEATAALFRRGLPEAVQAVRWHIAVALATLLAGVATAYLLVSGDESWFTVFVPGGYAGARGPASTRAELLGGEINAPWPGWAESFVAMAGFLFRHNTTIGVLSFSLGVLGGVPTLLLTAYQGLVFGAFLALHADRGLTVEFLGWVSIHGVTEFGAITLCAAGGLLVAEKALFPGCQSRRASVAASGSIAARVAVAALLLFTLAALIEGGLRQLVQDTPLRFAIGFGVGAAWMGYLARRVGPREPS